MRSVSYLLSGKDVNFGLDKVGGKRKRKSINDSLNESVLSNESISIPSLDNVDEVVKLRAVNEVQGGKLESIQSLFKKIRVRTHSRHNGGSVLKFGKKVKAYAISLLCQGESSVSINRSLKTLATICPEVLEHSTGAGDIPCRQTLDIWRSSLRPIHSRR